MFPSKRPSPDEGDERCESMVPEPKRRATLENAVRSIMGFGGLSLNRIVLNLEPMLRSWVSHYFFEDLTSTYIHIDSSSINRSFDFVLATNLLTQPEMF